MWWRKRRATPSRRAMLPDGRKGAKGSVERSAPVLRERHFSGASLITLIGLEFGTEYRRLGQCASNVQYKEVV